jgi:DNA invertase Pin-like site-specific DNA recombinase
MLLDPTLGPIDDSNSRRIGYSYVRFSTKAQGKEGRDSLRRQVELAERYCAANNIDLDSTLDLRDLGISAFRGANRAVGRLGAFLKAIDTGKVKRGSILLVESLDRLSRQEITESLTLMLQIVKAGVDIATLTDDRVYAKENIDDVANLMFSILIMARSNEESAIKSSRLKASWTAKRDKAAGKVMTSRVPAWLYVEDGEIKSNEERATIIRRIFDLSIKGYGAAATAKLLNDRGIDTFGDIHSTERKAKGWRQSYIRKILGNRAVVGELTPHKYVDGKRVPLDPIGDYFPKIVDEAVFTKAQQAIQSRKGKQGAVGKSVNVLTHLVKCKKCGGSAVRVNKGQKSAGPQLVCDNGRRGYTPCGYKSWVYSDVLNCVVQNIRELDTTIFDQDSSAEISKLQADVDRAHAEVASIDQKIERFVSAIELGGEMTALTSSFKRLEKDKSAALARRGGAEQSLSSERGRIRSVSYYLFVFFFFFLLVFFFFFVFFFVFLRSLVHRIDLLFDKQQLNIHYSLKEFERKSVVVFKSGKSVEFLEDEPPAPGV